MQTSKFAIALALACVASPALADEPAPSGTSADTTFTVGEIVVSANRMAGSTDNVLTSIDRLGGDVAQQANVNYAWELVGRLPGVLLTNFNQERPAVSSRSAASTARARSMPSSF